MGNTVAACFVSLGVCVATCVGVYGVPFVACQSEAMLHFHCRGPAPTLTPRATILDCVPVRHQNLSWAVWVSVCVAVHCGSLHMAVPTVPTTCLNGSRCWGVLCVLVSLCALWIVVQVYILDVSRAIRVRFTVCWGPEDCQGVSPNVVCLHVLGASARVDHVWGAVSARFTQGC